MQDSGVRRKACSVVVAFPCACAALRCAALRCTIIARVALEFDLLLSVCWCRVFFSRRRRQFNFSYCPEEVAER